MTITQTKLLHPNRPPRTWKVNLDTIKQVIPWARRNPDALVEEVEEMQSFFPFFITSITDPSNQGFASCPKCGNIIIVSDSFECVACKLPYQPHNNPLLGYTGRLVFNIGTIDKNEKIKGRPFLKNAYNRINKMRDDDEKELFNSYFLFVKDKIYFAPAVIAFYQSSGPSSEPGIYLPDVYFRILNIEKQHTNGNIGDNYRLCNFSSYHRQPLRMVLQTRAIPRIIIDMIIADLKIVGKLNKVMDETGLTLHDIYNAIGKPRRGQIFEQAFHRYVHID